jgi:hypothetical protein
MSDAIIEAAARALFASEMPDSDWEVFPGLHDKFRACARAVLAAVTPLIRAEAFEDAAKVAERFNDYGWGGTVGENIAAAIRSLKDQP